MKIAVCYSGLVRDNFDRNLKSVKHHFPDADYYFATWKKQTLPNVREKVYQFDEPKPHYHPFQDVVIDNPAPKFAAYKRKGKREGGHAGYTRTLHQTKQILAHAMLVDKIPAQDYDLIIRMRYDTFCSRQVDFSQWTKAAFEEQVAVGFGTRTSRHPNIHEFFEVPKIYPDNVEDQTLIQDWGWTLLDIIIIHSPKLFNTELVYSLYKEKKLWSSEFGWYQVLSQPFGDSHKSVYGGAQTNAFLKNHPGFDQ